MFPLINENNRICIISSGYLLSRALIISNSQKYDVLDLFRIKPFNTSVFLDIIKNYDILVNLEEQSANSGGFCSSISDVLIINGINKNVINFQLPEKYIFTNGSRDYLLDQNGLSIKEILDRIQHEFNKYY